MLQNRAREQPFGRPVRVSRVTTTLADATPPAGRRGGERDRRTPEVRETIAVEPPAPSGVGTGRGWGLARDAEFEQFMADASPVLNRMAWLLTGDAHRAEELVQQALVRTYVAWPRARAGDPLAYARRVLANARIDTWRKHRREVITSRDDLPGASTPSGAQAQAERDELARALLRLSPQRRRVVVLRYVMDLPEREVAADMNLSLGAVKSAASRGLAQLRSLLEDADDASARGGMHRPDGTDLEKELR